MTGVITILIAGFTNIFNIAFVFLLHFLSYIVQVIACVLPWRAGRAKDEKNKKHDTDYRHCFGVRPHKYHPNQNIQKMPCAVKRCRNFLYNLTNKKRTPEAVICFR